MLYLIVSSEGCKNLGRYATPDFHCVAECPESAPVVTSGNICTTCLANSSMTPYWDIEKQKCVGFCPAGAFLLEDGVTCVDSCSNYTFADNNMRVESINGQLYCFCTLHLSDYGRNCASASDRLAYECAGSVSLVRRI